MAERRLSRPVPRPQVVGTNTPTLDAVQRSLAQLVDQSAIQAPRPRSRVTADLVVGDNRIAHELGIAPRGATLCPRIADATFAWALTSRDDRIAVITVVGVAQPGADMEFYA